MALESRNKSRTYTFILSIIFLSGFSALVYQVLWSRMLMLVFGTSVPAVSTVLAAYMAGLALGSLIFGRLADKGVRVLHLYAFIEIGIGVMALLVPALIGLSELIYRSVGSGLESGSPGMTLMRFAMTFVILLPATTLIGGVLPAASKAVISHLGAVGNRTGRLYSINTLGSVLGAFLCGFFLIRLFGVADVNRAAAVLNLLIGAAIFAFARSGSKDMTELEKAPAASDVPINDAPRKESHGLLLFLYALAGFAALSYEVVWTRSLSYLLGNRVYAFTTIVAAFLVGIALGSYISSRFADRLKRPYMIFAINEILIGFLGVCSIPLLNMLPTIQNQLQSMMEPNWLNYFVIKFSVAFVPLLLPTLLMGAAFPYVIRIAVSSMSDIGAGIGRVNAANTAGAIFGSVLTGFILIPAFKVSGTIILLAGLYLLIGLSAMMLEKHPGMKGGLFYTGAVLATVTMVTIVTVPKEIGLGKTRPGANLIYYDEGTAGNVAVFEFPQTNHKLLEINGVGEVPTDMIGMKTFKSLGHLPFLIHRDPKQALMVTFGGGIAAGCAMLHPIDEMNCVEICDGVIEAARQCLSEENNKVLDSPRIKMHINDGRNYLLTTPRRFDVIISDATHPTGVDSWVLYTREFYQLCRDKLNENGLFAQWVPMHELTDMEYRSILSTCSAVFPEISLWVVGVLGSTGHTILIASNGELDIDAARIAERMQYEPVKSDLAEYGFNTPDDLLAYLKLTPANMPVYTEGMPVNTDDFSFLAFPQSPFKREPIELKIRNINKAAEK